MNGSFVTTEPTLRERFVGCLLGGAIGDALGAPVEFLSRSEIEEQFGSSGVRKFAPAYGGHGKVTDDTQMTLFTAEGLLRAEHRRTSTGQDDVPRAVHAAYLRWLSTQLQDARVPWDPDEGEALSGWLLEQRFLHSERSPGTTCVTALLGGDMGTPKRPLNDSKGCGGVIRVAPVGLVAADPFDLGCRVAAITHGHPSGWLAAGAFAQIICAITRGDPIRLAADGALERCQEREDGSEVAEAMRAALTMVDDGRSLTPETVELLGAGWVAEETLAISLFCALGATNPAEAMSSSASHGGDSDSTGSLTGNLLGAALGAGWLDESLLAQLEGRSVIEQVGSDLYDAFMEPGNGVQWEKYPVQ